jgi:SAM-dependent methyltransferase
MRDAHQVSGEGNNLGNLYRHDVWAVGSTYESYIGRWSRLVAVEFLDWLRVPASSNWLDVGCGTGALSEAILSRSSPRAVHGIDTSEDFAAHARQHVRDERIRFSVGHVTHAGLEAGSFDAAVSGLVLNFIPDLPAAMSAIVRAVKPGGLVGAYVWDYAGGMELIRHFWDSAMELNPAAAELDEGRRFPVCQPGPLREVFEEAGLRDIAQTAIDVPTLFRDFDDYWSPFKGGQGPAPGYAMSLSEEERDRLRERLRSVLPVRDDSSIRLIARAWAIKGRKAQAS